MPDAQLRGHKSATASMMHSIHSLAAIQHPNLVTIHNVCHKDSQLRIVSEHVPNGTLAQMLERCKAAKRTFHEDDVWSFLIPMARGLQVRFASIDRANQLRRLRTSHSMFCVAAHCYCSNAGTRCHSSAT